MFEDSVSIWPFLHTPQRPPQPDVHTTGSPSQTWVGFGGALGGGTSPWGMEHGGGWATASWVPKPSVAAANPPLIANAAKVVLIEGIGITPSVGTHPAT
jgi:hypothetical protein